MPKVRKVTFNKQMQISNYILPKKVNFILNRRESEKVNKGLRQMEQWASLTIGSISYEKKLRNYSIFSYNDESNYINTFKYSHKTDNFEIGTIKSESVVERLQILNEMFFKPKK